MLSKFEKLAREAKVDPRELSISGQRIRRVTERIGHERVTQRGRRKRAFWEQGPPAPILSFPSGNRLLRPLLQ